MRGRFLSLAAASALVIALPGSALGAASNVNDSFEVGTAFTVTGIPASIAYTESGGPVFGTSDTETVDMYVSTNADFEMTLAGTDFAGVTQPSLPLSYREALVSTSESPGSFLIGDGAGGLLDGAMGGMSQFYDFGTGSLDGAGLAAKGIAPLADAHLRVELRVDLPQGVPPDTYSGSMTFDFTSLAP